MSNDTAFTPPPAEKAFSPESLLKDKERTIPGLDTTKPMFDQPPVATGPVVHKHMTLEPPAEPVEAPVEPPEEQTAVVFCPACGHNMRDAAPLDLPTDEDKKDWLRHILGAERFYKEYSELGGNLKITLRTRISSEIDLVFSQLTAEIDSGKLTRPTLPAMDPAYMSRLSRLLLAVSLCKVETVGKPPRVFPVVTEKAYPNHQKDEKGDRQLILRAHDTIFGEMGEALLSIMVHVLRRFEATTATMIRRSEDQNFWLPAGGQN